MIKMNNIIYCLVWKCNLICMRFLSNNVRISQGSTPILLLRRLTLSMLSLLLRSLLYTTSRHGETLSPRQLPDVEVLISYPLRPGLSDKHIRKDASLQLVTGLDCPLHRFFRLQLEHETD